MFQPSGKVASFLPEKGSTFRSSPLLCVNLLGFSAGEGISRGEWNSFVRSYMSTWNFVGRSQVSEAFARRCEHCSVGEGTVYPSHVTKTWLVLPPFRLSFRPLEGAVVEILRCC